LLCVIPLPAARAAARPPSAKAVSPMELDKELAAYKGIRSLEAAFQQVKDMKAVQVKLKSSGTFRLRKTGDEGAEVEWEVSKPSYLKLRITNNSLEIFEQPGQPGKPLVENLEAQAKILRPIFAWLSMNSRLIGEQYTIYASGPHKFRLEPKDGAQPVKAIEITLNEKKLVSAVALEERSGDELRITFSGSKVEKKP
jgi:hypothetical protein